MLEETVRVEGSAQTLQPLIRETVRQS
jgi:hypothetical protein